MSTTHSFKPGDRVVVAGAGLATVVDVFEFPDAHPEPQLYGHVIASLDSGGHLKVHAGVVTHVAEWWARQ